MSILASLVRAYDRVSARDPDALPAFNYSREKIGYLIALNTDGTPAGLPSDLREGEGRKRTGRMMAVPASFKRSGIVPRPFFLWDNTAFALGITASEGKDAVSRLAAFRDRHQEWLAGSNDEGLQALSRFLGFWTPQKFGELGWSEEMKDQNVVFALESERLDNIRIHDRPSARALWARLSSAGGKTEAVCLVTGERGPVARLHPSIKGVRGAQPSGASIVSFNRDAFKSYGHKQGDNAPVSEAAAAAYTSVLNRFLPLGSGHRIQIGDASTVFWADASEAEQAEAAEGLFALLLSVDEKMEREKVADILQRLSDGRPVGDFRPALLPGVRFHVLGLAPNASRLSVRFYIEDDFGVIARRYAAHHERMRIDPPPREAALPMRRLLAVLRKSDNVQPNLAGEWMHAILTDTPYPLTLLSSVIMRLRADHDINALRVAILKSVLVKNFKVEAPVSLDPAFKDPGYLLGRLFAVYEQVQTAALGGSVNATIRDKFFGAASAQPRKVFPRLAAGSANHLSKVSKQSPGRRVNLEKAIGEIMELMQPAENPYPASLPDRSPPDDYARKSV